MDEFKDTNTAKLTREEFMAIECKMETGEVPAELEESMDPPSFIRSQSKKLLEIEDNLEDIHKMIEEKATRIEEKLVKKERDSEEEKDDQN